MRGEKHSKKAVCSLNFHDAALQSSDSGWYTAACVLTGKPAALPAALPVLLAGNGRRRGWNAVLRVLHSVSRPNPDRYARAESWPSATAVELKPWCIVVNTPAGTALQKRWGKDPC
jgi:hypothetical protein